MEESSSFLERHDFGRIAVVVNDRLYIFPVNYAFHMSSNPLGTIYIRSAPGDKLFAATLGNPVAFEVDEVQDSGAESVVVYGPSGIVQDSEESAVVDSIGLTPWVATYKAEIIAIDIDEVSGRKFIFGPQPDGVGVNRLTNKNS